MERPGRCRQVAAIAAAVFLCLRMIGASGADATPDAPAEAPVHVFRAPTLKTFRPGEYPTRALARRHEGWVIVNMMIDTTGRPFELSVVDSLGGPEFEREALKSLRESVFDPARDETGPVESGVTLKILFGMSDAKGARPEFVKPWRALDSALRNDDRASADGWLAGLEPMNLYEDAFLHLARYHYALRWGTKEEQLLHLRAALAGEERDRYLRRPVFVSTLGSLLALEVERNELGSAWKTWKRLEKLADPDLKKRWRPTIDQLEAARRERKSVHYTSHITRGVSSFHPLFHRSFEIVVASGRVSEIKLRCDKGYVLVPYTADMRYTVGERSGECVMEIIGDPGTRYDVIES